MVGQLAGDLGRGYVLVCPSTDPSWTPLFVNAAGLVQGTYNLKPVVKLPPSLQNFSLSQPTIHVVLLPIPGYHK